MTTIPVSWSAIAPEVVLLCCACVLLAGAIFLPATLARLAAPVVAGGGLLAALAIVAGQFGDTARYAFDGTLRIDDFGQAARLIVFAAALLAVLLSWGVEWMQQRSTEYHALLLCAAGGMSLLAVSSSFVTLFVALELFSICLYVLMAM